MVWLGNEMSAHTDDHTTRQVFDKRAILQNHPLFGALGSKLIEQLSAHAASKRIKRGTTISPRGIKDPVSMRSAPDR